jgi:hypothetical protein
MAHLANGAVFQQDLNNVEADFDPGVFQQAQVIKPTLG